MWALTHVESPMQHNQMESQRRVKGFYVLLCKGFVEKNYSKEQQDRIIGHLSADAKAALPNIKSSDWYPLHFANDFSAGIAAEHPSLEEREAAMIKFGRYIGETASSTFLKLLMKVLTMKMLADKWGAFWLKYHDFGNMRAHLDGEKHLVLYIVDCYDWMHLKGAGWIFVVCENLGLKGVKITNNMPAGQISAPEVRLDVTWAS